MRAEVLERERRTLRPGDSIGTIELSDEEPEIEHQVCHVVVPGHDPDGRRRRSRSRLPETVATWARKGVLIGMGPHMWSEGVAGVRHSRAT